jgi:hypothetical protein
MMQSLERDILWSSEHFAKACARAKQEQVQEDGVAAAEADRMAERMRFIRTHGGDGKGFNEKVLHLIASQVKSRAESRIEWSAVEWS